MLRIIVALFIALTVLPVQADPFPSKPVEIVIPFAPGGVSDLLVRAIAPRLQETFGQPVVVLNKPGGNGNAGTVSAMRAPPDGYTLIQTPLSSLSTNPFLYGDKLPYKADDLVLVSPLAKLPLFLYVHSSIPVKSMAEFVAWMRANPGSAYASAGVGGSNHLAGEMLRLEAKVDITHVPFNGSGPALNALLGGHVQWMFDSGRGLAFVKEGRLRLIAVATEQRLPEFPDVPTVAETFPGLVANGWHGLAAPPGTPPEIVARWNAAVTKALGEPEVLRVLSANFLVPFAAPAAQYADFVRAESKKWSEVIRRAGIKPE